MVKTHSHTHFFPSPPIHFESTHHFSLGFFASLRVFEFWSIESFQACMQHKVCFKWPIDPWIPLKWLLGKTYPRHWSWREPTTWGNLTIYVDKIMDVVVIGVSFDQSISSKLRYYPTISFANFATTKLKQQHHQWP